ncbi:MAG: EamA family transporter [Acidimicrobiia bacterium]|jgi:drug/metabolite transporter (DMT)-like permease
MSFRSHVAHRSAAINHRASGPIRLLGSFQPGQAVATGIIAISAVGFGLIPFFARGLTDAGMASSAVTFYRWGLSAALTLPFLRLTRKKLVPLAWGLGAGLGLGLGWMAYVEALAVIPVSTVGVIYMSYPVFALLAGWLVFSRRPGRRSMFGAGMVALAAFVALSPAALGSVDIGALALAFAAPLSFGFAITVLTERLNRLEPLERISAVGLGAVAAVSPMFLSLPKAEMVPTAPGGWWLVLGMAILTSLLPKLGYTLAAPFVGTGRTATAGAIELPTIFLVGWLAFGESLGWAQIAAAALILAAVLLTPSRPPTWDLETKGAGAGPRLERPIMSR